MKAVTAGGIWIDSKHTGNKVFQMFFRLDDGTSARTYIDPSNRNAHRWKDVISSVEKFEKVTLDGVKIRKKSLVDADSVIKIIEQKGVSSI